MCKLLNEKEKNSGKGKNFQIKKWKRHFNFERENFKYIITEVYNEPILNINLGNNRKDYKQFKIPLEDENKCGVYSITLNNDIYVGSTINNFRERFREHTYKNNPLKHTYDMIHNGGIFKTLWIAEEGTSEFIIRTKEREYIKYYEVLSNWNLINLRINQKGIYKSIKIKAKEIDQVTALLKSNNLYYKIK